MSAVVILAIGGLTGVGIYLITARSLSRIILGFALLGHAAVLGLITAGGSPGNAPIADLTTPQASANPLPQALALTAIVISFGLTLFLLALASRQQELTGDDTVEDDLEDRRIAYSETFDAEMSSIDKARPFDEAASGADAGSGSDGGA